MSESVTTSILLQTASDSRLTPTTPPTIPHTLPAFELLFCLIGTALALCKVPVEVWTEPSAFVMVEVNVISKELRAGEGKAASVKQTPMTI